MAFVTVEDMFGSVEVIVFPKILQSVSDLLVVSGVITVQGTLSVEEEKEPKILANSITGAPGPNAAAGNPVSETGQENREPVSHKKGKHRGLFLRFDSEKDERIKKAKIITSIFEGDFPLCFYYKDKKHYDFQKRADFTAPNPTMLEELCRLLGNENVVVMD